jgi:hypothetical protein
LGRELSRRDDLHSLLYLLVEFLKGYLPWRRVKDKDSIGQLKMEHNAMLCEGLPPNYEEMRKYIESLEYESEPDYEYLIKLLAVDHIPSEPLDWESDFSFAAHMYIPSSEDEQEDQARELDPQEYHLVVPVPPSDPKPHSRPARKFPTDAAEESADAAANNSVSHNNNNNGGGTGASLDLATPSRTKSLILGTSGRGQGHGRTASYSYGNYVFESDFPTVERSASNIRGSGQWDSHSRHGSWDLHGTSAGHFRDHSHASSLAPDQVDLQNQSPIAVAAGGAGAGGGRSKKGGHSHQRSSSCNAQATADGFESSIAPGTAGATASAAPRSSGSLDGNKKQPQQQQSGKGGNDDGQQQKKKTCCTIL